MDETAISPNEAPATNEIPGQEAKDETTTSLKEAPATNEAPLQDDSKREYDDVEFAKFDEEEFSAEDEQKLIWKVRAYFAYPFQESS